MLELDKIYNMDCIEGLKKIPKDTINLIITDPPFFNPAAHYISRDKSKAKRSYGDMSIMKHAFKGIAKECSKVLKPNAHLLFFCDCVTYPVFFEAFYDYFGYTRALIWYKGKNYFSLGKGAWRYSYEMILHSFNTNQFYVQLNRQDVIESSVVPQKKRNHQAEKPIELTRNLIFAVTNKGDTVLDMFMGGGTTGVACRELGRHFIGFEINDEYCKIPNKRLANVPEKLDLFSQVNNGLNTTPVKRI